MKKILIRSAIFTILGLNVCFANTEMPAIADADVAVASSAVVADQQKQVESKVAYKNVALMEHKLKKSSGTEMESLADLIKDKKAVLLDFYTTWCGPCKQLMPELKKTSERLAPQGVSVVGINVDRNEAGAEGIRKQNGIEFPWLIEGADEMHSKHFNVDRYPTTILLSQEGEVLFKGHPQDAKLKAALEKLGVSL